MAILLTFLYIKCVLFSLPCRSGEIDRKEFEAFMRRICSLHRMCSLTLPCRVWGDRPQGVRDLHAHAGGARARDQRDV